MKLLKLEASNIFSIGKVSLDLANRGLLLITGHSYDEGSANGAGKSSIANKAVSWGLYGQTFGGVKADSVINSNNPDQLSYVAIEFIGVNGTSYDVRRQRNPAKLEFYSELIDLTQRNEKDTQALINKALGKDFKTFSHTDFFGQGRTESFFSLTPAEQKQIIESILPMDKLSTWTENCKKARQSLLTKFTQVKEQKIKSGAVVDALEQQKSSLHSNSINWRAGQEVKIRKAKEDIEKAKQNQLVANEKLNEVQTDIQTLRLSLPGEDLDKLKESLEVNTSRKEELNTRIFGMERQILFWETEEKDKEANLLQFKDNTCGLCKQSIPETVFKEQTSLLTNRINALKNSTKIYRGYINEEANKLQAVDDKVSSDTQTHTEITNKLSQIMGLENRLEILKSHQHNSMVDIYVDNLKALETNKNPYEDMLGSIIKQFEIHKANLVSHQNNLNVLDREIELVKKWEDGYAYDIKNMLIEQVCPFLEERTNQYMQDLNNPQIRSIFSTTKVLKSGEARDEFNITVKSMTGGKEYDLFSGGEQNLVSFAVGMALADLASSQAEGSSEILILDEPFMGLSARNCENVVTFLTQVLGKKKSTILLISNEDELSSLIPQSIKVIKKNGISSIEN